MSTDGISRREFVKTAGGAAVGTWAATLPVGTAVAPRRYAMVGTGVRGIGMWGRPIVNEYKDAVELVGLCDINPLRVEAAKKQIGVSARPSPASMRCSRRRSPTC